MVWISEQFPEIPAIPPPAVLQAEAYCGDTCVLIRNSRTENVADLTKRLIVNGDLVSRFRRVPTAFYEVPDFPAFLDATVGLTKGARVLVALGDSKTANVGNWPSVLAYTHLLGTDVVVVNLADWALCSEANAPLLEYYLHWLNAQAVSGSLVVLLHGLRDIGDRIVNYHNFMEHGHPVLLSDVEEQLTAHRYGAELARLSEAIPTEWDVAYRWIARRVLAVVKLLDRLCVDTNTQFFAVLEPNSYPDYSPGYQAALRRAYEIQADPAASFEAWCGERGYTPDPSALNTRDLRTSLEHLRALWQAEGRRSRHGAYVDWSGLFRNVDDCCFNENFDAVHYSQLGIRLIAEAVFDLLPSAIGPSVGCSTRSRNGAPD